MLEPPDVAGLIGLIGQPGMMGALDTALQRAVQFDLSCVFVYPKLGPPLLPFDGFRGFATDAALAQYVAGAYLLDCVYTACKHGTKSGLYRISEFAPDAFFEGEYFNSPEVHPCISSQAGSLAEEIVIFAGLPTGATAAYSLMRAHGQAAFDATTFAALKAAAPIIVALIAQQFAALGTPGSQGMDQKDGFETFATDILSDRERAIAAMVLQGHSSASIGLNLGIAEGTVKIHRKNIHAKLRISSQAELFALFLRHLRVSS
jgi:DNA-binding CsgD family transcriptional regulator